MSKVLPASCENGQVKVGDVIIQDAIILGAGVAPSSGFVVLEGTEPPYYIVAGVTDLKTTLTKLSAILDDLTAALTKVATTFTSIGAGMTGPTTSPPPTLPADVLNIVSKVTSLTSIKAEIDQLKGNLQ